MDTAYADITVILDRSSSMQSMQDGVVKGFNDYIEKMRQTPGDSRWTMIQFDDPSSAKGANEPFPHTMFEFQKETEVPFLSLRQVEWRGQQVDPSSFISGCCTFVPRGSTALVDAVCTVIERTEARVSGQLDRIKPIVVIVTDGEENASTKFNSSQMREMIARTQGQGWQYIYLGANQDAFHEAGKYGISQNWMQNTVGGALVAPPVGLSRDACSTNTYVPTSFGIAQAIASGMTGVACTVSGSITHGMLNRPSDMGSI